VPSNYTNTPRSRGFKELAPTNRKMGKGQQ